MLQVLSMVHNNPTDDIAAALVALDLRGAVDAILDYHRALHQGIYYNKPLNQNWRAELQRRATTAHAHLVSEATNQRLRDLDIDPVTFLMDVGMTIRWILKCEDVAFPISAIDFAYGPVVPAPTAPTPPPAIMRRRATPMQPPAGAIIRHGLRHIAAVRPQPWPEAWQAIEQEMAGANLTIYTLPCPVLRQGNTAAILLIREPWFAPICNKQKPQIEQILSGLAGIPIAARIKVAQEPTT